MKILIVDDVELARERLKRLVNELGFLEAELASGVEEAKQKLIESDYDLIFLDIEMNDGNGLEFAEFIRENTKSFIVFATAYEQYALEAFEKDGIGYLLKPISKEDVEKVIKKVEQFSNNTTSEKKILGKIGKKIFLISPKEIIYISADLNEIIVRTKENSYYVSQKLSQIEETLPTNFFKVHRSHIVNIDEVKSLESIEQSKYIISFKTVKDEVVTSKEGAKRLREFLEK